MVTVCCGWPWICSNESVGKFWRIVGSERIFEVPVKSFIYNKVMLGADPDEPKKPKVRFVIQFIQTAVLPPTSP